MITIPLQKEKYEDREFSLNSNHNTTRTIWMTFNFFIFCATEGAVQKSEAIALHASVTNLKLMAHDLNL